jgi:hypothetical protein
MPQISLYIDKDTLEKIEQAALSEDLSISGWVGKQLRKSLDTGYPANFASLYGSVSDESFVAPARESFHADAKRTAF